MDLRSPKSVIEWLKRRPGTFESNSENRVWRKAWEEFNDGEYHPGESIRFMSYVLEAGFDVRPTALGGYILDAKP